MRLERRNATKEVSREYKLKAIKLVRKHGSSVAQAARELNVFRTTVYRASEDRYAPSKSI